ncbi:MAG: M20 metallopeptidase family protein [Thermomicrobiales bacterium]
MSSAMVALVADVDEILPGVVADRRWLHEHPELGFHETETAAFVLQRLESLGVDDIRTGVGGTGVTALIRGTKESVGPGKVLMLRADMDALPILEANETEYASKTPGVMHACGHDAHTAMLLATARVLMERRNEFAGTVKLLFQPAEEAHPGGAIGMIRDGALEDPHVDASLGLHVMSDVPTGVIGVQETFGTSNSDRFTLRVKGKGGHASAPHNAVDPVVIGSHIIVALQNLVSRETDPMEPAVLSVTANLAGEAFNVIPDSAEIRGTVRTYSEAVQDHIERRMGEVAAGVAQALGGEATLDYRRGYPCLPNDAGMAAIVRAAAIEVVGEERVITPPMGMGGEDYAYFARAVPACFFWVGVKNDEKGFNWPHHHPRFDIDEDGMAAGIATMAAATIRYLNEAG